MQGRAGIEEPLTRSVKSYGVARGRLWGERCPSTFAQDNFDCGLEEDPRGASAAMAYSSFL
jgi:hypothetical protein